MLHHKPPKFLQGQVDQALDVLFIIRNVNTSIRYIDVTRASDRLDSWLYFHFFLD